MTRADGVKTYHQMHLRVLSPLQGTAAQWQDQPAMKHSLTLCGVIVAQLLLSPTLSQALPGHWQPRETGLTTTLNGIAYGGGIFVAVGDQQTILSSSNACTWTLRRQNSALPRPFRGVTYGNGLFLAVGSREALIYSSSDGLHWQSAIYNVEDRDLNGIVYAKGIFVAVGYDSTVPSSYILTSTNGAIWFAHLLKPLNQRLNAVAYGNDGFVAVGTGGT